MAMLRVTTVLCIPYPFSYRMIRRHLDNDHAPKFQARQVCAYHRCSSIFLDRMMYYLTRPSPVVIRAGSKYPLYLALYPDFNFQIVQQERRRFWSIPIRVPCLAQVNETHGIQSRHLPYNHPYLARFSGSGRGQTVQAYHALCLLRPCYGSQAQIAQCVLVAHYEVIVAAHDAGKGGTRRGVGGVVGIAEGSVSFAYEQRKAATGPDRRAGQACRCFG